MSVLCGVQDERIEVCTPERKGGKKEYFSFEQLVMLKNIQHKSKVPP
jgi:hypothetical protein